MEKQRKIKILSLIVLIIAILGLTIAFAALSQTLKINGNASVDTATWDVHFESIRGDTKRLSMYYTSAASNLENVEMNYEDSGIPTKISDDGASITDVLCIINMPGDECTYNFKIVNNGTINAKISNIINNEPQFGVDFLYDENGDYNIEDIIGTTGEASSEDIETYNKWHYYKLLYADTNEEVKENDIISAGETKNIILKLGFSKDADKLPTSLTGENFGLVVYGLGTTITYSQDN